MSDDRTPVLRRPWPDCNPLSVDPINAPRYDDDRREVTRHPPALADALARLRTLEDIVLALIARVGTLEDERRREGTP
jgi:hypothetical protein